MRNGRVERFGGSQTVTATEFSVSPAAVTQMLGKLRRKGVTEKEAAALDAALKKLHAGDAQNDKNETTKTERVEPKVITVRRKK